MLCLHLHGRGTTQPLFYPEDGIRELTLVQVNVHYSAQSHIPEGNLSYIHHCENVTFHSLWNFSCMLHMTVEVAVSAKHKELLLTC